MITPETPTVVITGSASGIGQGLARAFLARGCRVTISDLPGARLAAAAAELGEPQRLAAQPCDVARYQDLEALWDAAVDRFGRIDVWINNAGVGPPVTRLDQVEPEWIERALAVNLRGIMFGTRVALGRMLVQGKGAIYNTVGFGYDGRKQNNLTVYGTTKAGARYFSESTAGELGRDCPVRVGWLNPGFVLTPMTIEENRRVRERVGEEQWRRFRRVMNAVADSPDEACPWIADRVLRRDRTIDRLPPAVFLRRLVAAVVTRPDPLAAFGL